MRDVREIVQTAGVYLKKDDIPTDKLVTVKNVGSGEVENSNKIKERWPVIFFHETGDKGLLTKRTNLELAIKIFGSHDVDAWVGKQCVIYVDPSVEFPKGTKIGGLRLRMTKQQQLEELHKKDDDIPF